MHYNIESQTCSFGVMLILAIVFFSKSRLKNFQNQIYGVLLLLSLVTLFFDIASVLAIHHHAVIGGMTDFITKTYHCLIVIWVTTISIYAISLTKMKNLFQKKTRLAHIGVIVGVLVEIAVCIFIMVTDMHYYVEGRECFSYGMSSDLTYLYAFISIMFCMLLVIFNYKSIPWIKQLSIYVYFGIIMTAGLIQRFHPDILIVSSGGTLTMVFMYFTLENPDVALIAELNQARKEADKANQAKANFLANMSHEIRTPINAVLGMNEMILREHPSKEITDYARQIERAGHNLLSIVNDILDFSKIESGKMEIVPTKYLMYSMLQEIYSIGNVSAAKKGLEFELRANSDFPRILYGDEIRIKQIIMNLMSNAVKYTKQGKVTILFDYERSGEAEIDFTIYVIDTGQGIRKESRGNLFESFQRIEQEKNRYIEGSGLGLAITRELLEEMNGSIEVESEYGIGSTFIVHLPQKIVDETPMGEFVVQKLPKITESGKWKGIFAPQAKIMVVDDNEVNLAVAAALLKQSGAEVTLVTGGRECLEKLREDTYQILFIDYNMPEMNGPATVEQIKKEKLRGEAALIVLSGDDLSGSYREWGFQDYLRKPLEPRQLDMTLRTYLPREYLQDGSGEVK